MPDLDQMCPTKDDVLRMADGIHSHTSSQLEVSLNCGGLGMLLELGSPAALCDGA